jgi:hypothetical protein
MGSVEAFRRLNTQPACADPVGLLADQAPR